MAIKIKEVAGFSKEEALKASGLEFEVIEINATQAWTKAGKPSFGSADFKKFAEAFYANKLAKKASGSAAVVVVEGAVEDTRIRPYKFERIERPESEFMLDEDGNKVKDENGKSIITKAFKTKWERQYQIVDKATGYIWTKADTMGNAEKAAKEVTAIEHVDVVIKDVQVPVNRPEIVATCDYTPAAKTKEGRYIFFGVERD